MGDGVVRPIVVATTAKPQGITTMRLCSILGGAALLFGLAAQNAFADVALTGSFTAERACPAYQSFRRGTNPGNVSIAPGRTYPLLAKNKDDATHYRLRIEGAQPVERWVEIGCGSVSGDGNAAAPPPTGDPPAAARRLVLAISWQPGFCEGHPRVAECRTQAAGRADAKNFALHGLWPQPNSRAYCGVAPNVVEDDKAHRWDALPQPGFSAETQQRLDAVMPGTQSALDRHEWIKHGTCYGADADTYFSDAIRLLAEINASAVQKLVAARIGRTVTAAELRAAFDRSFGPGAGERVRLSCAQDGDRRLITEVTIGLVGNPSAGTPLGPLIAASAPTDPGCDGGIIDRVGLQ